MAESHDSLDLHWIDPENRGILPLDKIHISRSLRKSLRKEIFEIRCNTSFSQVLDCCSATTSQRPDTWINPLIKRFILNFLKEALPIRLNVGLITGLLADCTAYHSEEHFLVRVCSVARMTQARSRSSIWLLA